MSEFKEYFINQTYSLLNETDHKIKLESEDKKTSVTISYPDTAFYHQAGWDIMLQIQTEEKEQTYYAEVKTHTEQSIRRGVLDLSNKQMQKAAECSSYYFVLEVSYNWKKRQAVGMTYYQDPIKKIAQGKLYSINGRYELRSIS